MENIIHNLKNYINRLHGKLNEEYKQNLQLKIKLNFFETQFHLTQNNITQSNPPPEDLVEKLNHLFEQYNCFHFNTQKINKEKETLFESLVEISNKINNPQIKEIQPDPNKQIDKSTEPLYIFH